MPRFRELVDVVDLMNGPRIAVSRDACIVIRNRTVACGRCAAACIRDCIEVKPGDLSIDHTACVGCGVCASVCPTSALVAQDPAESTLSDLLVARGEEHRVCAVACSRFADGYNAVTPPFVTVPCLARLTERVLCEAAAAGAQRIVLIDGGCVSCDLGSASPYIDITADNARMLLESVGAAASIDRASFLPKVLAELSDDVATDRGADRRALFEQTGRFLSATVLKAADAALEDALDRKDPGRSSRRPRRDDDGTLAKLPARRNDAILDALYMLGEPVDEAFSTRLFGSVGVETASCDGCGLCAAYCPTRALCIRDGAAPDSRWLEFRQAQCVQCRTCEQVCPHACIAVSDTVSAPELFALDPVEFSIPPRQEEQPDLSHVVMATSGAEGLLGESEALRAILAATHGISDDGNADRGAS